MISEALDGLPPSKMHCSVLAEEAIEDAIDDCLKKDIVSWCNTTGNELLGIEEADCRKGRV